LITNGFYAAAKRKSQAEDSGFEPVLRATTKNIGHAVEIRIRDNGTGISADVKDKIFNRSSPPSRPARVRAGPFDEPRYYCETTRWRIDVTTEPGRFTEFTIVLPTSKT